ncbi:glycosyltransferase family 2 protein [Helcococcus kunzii]|uniref:glycosyltransferase family 2 protein n=1 Tax=Helcococcus kunzii TaxID=40091 RepID=UPI001C98DC42|nr:glycosyltransferase family 2 protein [Helcococcus kunzii]QZO76531.1 glycosyltransferase family 2 protein [Helcococcus kunzii]
MKNTVLWLVIPCYNEEKVLPITAPLFLAKLKTLISEGKISDNSKILFVNDGSKDETWEIIKNLSKQEVHFEGICQSRNRGHQNAVLAGLMEAKKYADITISIDCDGQDDINAIDKMIEEYHNGNEVVYGVRDDRSTDTFFKRITAQTYYKILNKLGAEIIYNHADYRLISKRVLDEFANYKEVNLFLRGLIPLIGFKSTSVYYKRNERMAGESHYPFFKMISLAADGITSLSIKPIRMVTSTGLLISILGFIGVIWAIISYLLGKTVSGWASLICIVSILGGMQLISLGVIGEYVGKTYMETKSRPRYIISERTYENSSSNSDFRI